MYTTYDAFRELGELKSKHGRLNREHMTSVSKKLQASFPGVRGYAVASLYRKWRRYQESNGQLAALFPRRTSSIGINTRKFGKEVLELFQKAVQLYLTPSKPDIVEIYSVFEKDIREINAGRDPEHHLKVPHESTFRRWIGKLDPLHAKLMREGEVAARRDYGIYGTGEVATRPMQIVEVDHTPIDLSLIDELLGLPCARAYLTALICVASRCCVGFYIGFEPPSYYSVMRALQHAILPKDYVKLRYPSIKNAWPCYGMIERLVVDNGPEFHSADLERVCSHLGIRIEYTAKRQPHLKGKIERFLQTVNSKLQNMPSKRFGKAINAPEFDPDLHAYATLEGLIYAIHILIIDVYHQRPHRGVADIPAERFVRGTVKFPLRLPNSIEDLNTILGRRAERSLQPDGIEFNSLQYFSPERGEIRNHPDFNPNGTVEFYYEPNDCSSIFVRHPNGRFVTAFAQGPGNYKGISFTQLKLLKNHARRKLNRKADWDGIKAAMEDFRVKLGFYDRKRRKRPMNRTETSVRSALTPQEPFADVSESHRQQTKNTVRPVSDKDPLDHRQKNDKAWKAVF